MRFVLLFVLPGVLIFGLAPVRWGWRLAAGLVVIFVALTPWIFPASRNGDGWMGDIVRAALLLVALIWCAALVARVVFDAWRHDGSQASPGDAVALRGLDHLLCVGAAAIVARDAFFAIGGLAQGQGNAERFHLFLVILCALSACTALLRLRGLPRTASVAFLAAVAAMTPWSAFVLPKSVRASAVAIADGQPYCIATLHAKRPVDGTQDLTFIGIGREHLQNHAVMFVQGPDGLRGYHWSYRASAFLRGVSGINTPRHCAPRLNFLDTPRPEPDGIRLIFAGEDRLVPRSLAPRLSGNYLTLNVAPFPPLVALDRIGSATIWLGSRIAAESLHASERARHPPGEEEYGLSTASCENGAVCYRFRLATDGKLATALRILGSEKAGYTVEHTFLRGNDTFTLRYPVAEIAGWQAIETRFLVLWDSFRVEE